MLDTLKAIPRLIIGIPVGLYWILTGIALILMWKLPAAMGSEFAEKGVVGGYDSIENGKEWMTP